MTTVRVPPVVDDPHGLARLIDVLDGPRYIGGWVRDTLLGLSPDDIDVATPLPPRDAEARARAAGLHVWSSAAGIAHGTIGVVVGGKTVEVTTLRRDVTTDGRHAKVSFTRNWREDAARRDFTINALSADPITGAVHDYFDGLPDLSTGTVRFIGRPEQRIAEDHLRILRFFRFHARFGTGAPDAASYAVCVERAKDLMTLSRERIAAELLKLLALPDPVPTIDAMLEGGLFLPILPEVTETAALSRLIGSEQEAQVPGDGIRRLSALLPNDPEIAEHVAARFRLSKADRRRLVQNADPQSGRADALAYGLGLPAAIDSLLLRGYPDQVAMLRDWERPRLTITGGELITLGLSPGPRVAATLQALERWWVSEGFPDRDVVEAKARTMVADAL